MGTATRVSILQILAMTACGFPRPDNVATIGGNVRGIWNGADGVALQLRTTALDTLLTVPTDGAFSFPDQLLEGTSYSVVVAADPVRHTCIVESGGNGAVADTDVTTVSIVCTGPEVAIDLSGQWGWTFDPSQEQQTFAGSILVQDVSLTVTGVTLTSANVDHSPATIGEATQPIVLPLGSLPVAVELTASGGLSKSYQLIFNRGDSVLDQVVYGKASNAKAQDSFGLSFALAGDTLAVAAPLEDSSATGVNNQTNNAFDGAGAVYVFVRNGMTWIQQAYIKASNTGPGDNFGSSIALSGDTLAVAATGEASNATGVNSDQADNSARDAGAVYVFARSSTTWTQQAYIKASDTGTGRRFGSSLALTGDTLAVSGNQLDASVGVNGAVYVFVRSGESWTQQGRLTALDTPPAPGAESVGIFLLKLALSGNTLAVPATEVNIMNGLAGRSAVYVLARSGTTWTQQAYLTVSSEGTQDQFGASVSISGDTLAVGAPLRVQGDTSRASASFVHIFARAGTTWMKQAQLTGSNTTTEDNFGAMVALSGDTLAVGAHLEGSEATGVNGDQGDGASQSGAVYVFSRTNAGWTQQAYVKASNTGAGDRFGFPVALSADTLVVGAIGESSGAIGINPEPGQLDDSADGAGAIYIFR